MLSIWTSFGVWYRVKITEYQPNSMLLIDNGHLQLLPLFFIHLLEYGLIIKLIIQCIICRGKSREYMYKKSQHFHKYLYLKSAFLRDIYGIIWQAVE